MKKNKKSLLKKTKKIMSRNSILLAAIGGAAVAAVLTNYLGSEKGKEMLNTASNTIKDLANKATEYAKDKMPQGKNATDTANVG
jgi:hypothetical protein